MYETSLTAVTTAVTTVWTLWVNMSVTGFSSKESHPSTSRSQYLYPWRLWRIQHSIDELIWYQGWCFLWMHVFKMMRSDVYEWWKTFSGILVLSKSVVIKDDSASCDIISAASVIDWIFLIWPSASQLSHQCDRCRPCYKASACLMSTAAFNAYLRPC